MHLIRRLFTLWPPLDRQSEDPVGDTYWVDAGQVYVEGATKGQVAA